MKFTAALIILSILFLSCVYKNETQNQSTATQISNQKTNSSLIGIDELTDTMIADGFDFPVGNIDGKGKYTSKTNGKVYDSWYISTIFTEKYSLGIHPGIDLNGSGGGNTDLGQPVYSIAGGIIVEAEDYGSPWGNVVLIKHKYLENGHLKFCFSLYAHLENLKVSKGNYVNKRTKIGEIGTGGGSYPAHLHLEIRKEKMKDYAATYWPGSHKKDSKWVKEYYEDPLEFINTHRKITSPLKEEKIIIAIKHSYKLYYYEKGKLKKKYEIALSQNPVGHKEKAGDLKMPEGEYYISEKQKAPFSGRFSEYLGPRLIRISYPNTFDAISGYKKGLINQNEMNQIIAANKAKQPSPKSTKLGGGIVIHGWNGEWTADGNQNQTWGCISMHNNELLSFYDIVQLQTKIIIHP